MNRRKFLGTAATAAVIATWPGWLRRAFAETPALAKEAAGLAVLSEGYRHAQRAGKPLLVLVIPADDGQKYDRGRAFGEYLNHGSAEQLAPLALCEVACAEMAKLRRLAPAAGEGEPLMVLIETDQVPARVQRFDVALVEEPERDWRVVDEDDPADPPKKNETEDERWQRRFTARQRREEAVIAKRIEQIAALVKDAVQPDVARLAERAAQARAHVPSVGAGGTTALFDAAPGEPGRGVAGRGRGRAGSGGAGGGAGPRRATRGAAGHAGARGGSAASACASIRQPLGGELRVRHADRRGEPARRGRVWHGPRAREERPLPLLLRQER